jgi:hypothetical protein
MILKKLIYSFLLVCLFSTGTYAQKLMHGIGLTPTLLFGTSDDGYDSKVMIYQNMITYYPRFNFVENENSSISIGAPIGVGFGLARNTDYSDVGISFSYDLPVALDYNIGCKSTSENEHYFGGYLGAGFGYYKVSISKSAYSDFNGATYGPMARAGVRIGSAKESWKEHALTVGFFYKKGIEKAKFSTVGCNVLVDL